jgi:hypothetical protein
MRLFFVASLLATAAGCATVREDGPPVASNTPDPAFVRRATTQVTPAPLPAFDATRTSDGTASGPRGNPVDRR